MNLSTLNPNELVGPSGRNVQSAYFDGTGDYLTTPDDAAFDFGTSDFTIECWVYIAANASTNNDGNRPASVFSTLPASGTLTNAYALTITGSSTTTGTGMVFNNWQSGSASTITSTTALTQSTWNHIAVARSGTTTKLFLNGAEVASGTLSNQTVNSQNTIQIGRTGYTGYLEVLNGYISNLRVLKGTALYTANFTPPTAPLTAITNTSFLLGFSEYRFIDQSPNNFTITRNGDTTQSTFGPYGDNWSNYFDGTDDGLTSPTNSAYSFGTGDFTIEAWVYIAGNSAIDAGGVRTAAIVGSFPTSGTLTNVWVLGISGNSTTTGTGFFFQSFVSGTTYTVSVTTTLSQTTWHHLAVARSGTTTKLFLNGSEVASGTLGNQNVNGAYPIYVGRNIYTGYPNVLNGYISNVRVVKGTAVYTSNFTPPTAPLPVIPNTSLLTCQSNRFLDASPNNFAITRNGDVSVQPYVPFPANWSNYFDGNGDNLKVTSSLLQLGTSDFTLEFWAYFSSFGSSDTDFFRHDTGSQSVGIGVYNFGADLRVIYFPTGATVANFGAKTQIGLNQWTHVAITRSGNNFRCFLNGGISSTGVQVSSQNLTLTTTNTFRIMEGSGAVYISNYRLIIGTALYTSNFTPPTTPLTAIPNTSLLTCQSSSFTDFSSNNFTVTVTGDVSARFYGPFSGPVPEPAVDVYTTTGVANTWTKRPGAKAVQMIAIGAGGGGGGGMGSASGVQRNGGAGGGGGANGQIIYTADQLPSTLYIRVGASGTGGASNTSGGAGGNSTIAAADPITTSTSVYCMGGGGGGGEAGAASSSSVGGGGGGTAGAGTTGTGDNAVSGGVPALGAGFALGGGGAGGGNGAAGTTSYAAEWGGGGGGGVRNDGANRQPGGGSLYGGGGGGVGGFLNSGGGGTDGICGGASGRYTFGTDQSNFGGGAAGAGSAGGAGANASTLYAAGSGGGGGGTSGFAGGAGGFPGGGGGGGGASSSTGGTGGVGGAGRVVLITFF